MEVWNLRYLIAPLELWLRSCELSLIHCSGSKFCANNGGLEGFFFLLVKKIYVYMYI